MQAVQFEVSYGLGEYRQFVLEHFHHLTGKRPGVFGRFLVSAFATPLFFIKEAKIGRCAFTADEEAIVRRSRLGDYRMAWRDVTAVHRYSPGFLIENAGGAIPIPYRCLTPDQRSSVEALVLRWRDDA